MKNIYVFLAIFLFNTHKALAQTDIVSDIDAGSRYKFIIISISLLLLYLLSSLAVKFKYISLLNHRRLWNVLLLIVFLVTAVFGVMLVIVVNFSWFSSWYVFMLYWHVEFGTAMVMITMFHLSWHWRYYFLIFKKTPKINIENKQ